MSNPTQLTFSDLVDHLVDYASGSTAERTMRDIVRACQSGYRDVTFGHQWNYYRRRFRINTSPPYTTGTIAYADPGVSNPREVALTGGIWPDWAAGATLLIGTVKSLVRTRVDDTTLILDENLNPGADVASGTSYTLLRPCYTLPADFRGVMDFSAPGTIGTEAISVEEWLQLDNASTSTGQPLFYTIMGDPLLSARMAIWFYPYPAALYNYDAIYLRTARPLKYWGSEANESTTNGTVTITSGSRTVTGVGTEFTADMVGSMLRLTQSTTELPTGLPGDNPYTEQVIIGGYTSATSIELTEAVTQDYSGVKMQVSDPVDVDVSMLEVLLRAVERQFAITRNRDKVAQADQFYRQAMVEAREHDARYLADKVAGQSLGDRGAWNYLVDL